METSDIFTSITKYHKPENQFTASLVYLLRYLWDNSKGEQRRRLCCFLSQFCGAPFAIDQNVIFTIQKAETEDEDESNGRTIIPDFQIDSGSALVWVEVKDEASLEDDQLKKYKNELSRKEGYKQKNLVLLRHHFMCKEDTKDANNDIRWCELYVWLKDMARNRVFDKESVSDYLLNELLKHMEQKGVPPVDKISREHLKGFPGLVSLLTIVREEAKSMLGNALKSEIKVSETDFGHDRDEEGEFDYVSFYFYKGRKKSSGYYVEVYYCTESKSNGFSMGLKTKSEWVEEIEDNRLEVPTDSKEFPTDDEGFVYVIRDLDSGFCEETLGGQSDMIGKLLQEMYSKLNTIKIPLRTRAKRKR